MDKALNFGMPKKVFSKSFAKIEWVCVALLGLKSRPKFDEGIFDSYVHLNLVVPDEGKKPFPCEECDKSFAEKRSLNHHMLSFHEEKMPLSQLQGISEQSVQSNSPLERV